MEFDFNLHCQMSTQIHLTCQFWRPTGIHKAWRENYITDDDTVGLSGDSPRQPFSGAGIKPPVRLLFKIIIV